MDFTYNYTGAAGDHGAGTTAGNAGQLIAMTGTLNGASRDQTFRYDDLGRLATATGSDVSGLWQRRFVYDRWGNRTQVWNATTGGSQIQQVNLALIGSAPSNRVSSYWDTAATGGATKTVSYDAAGNTTNDGTYSFTYDAENRIVQVNAVGTGALVATYTYDSANRRIKKTAGATTTCYLWEGAQVIAEYNNAASPLSPNTEYIFTGGRMLAEERAGSGTTRFFHQDRLSTRLTTNSSGAVLGTQSHLPFGEALSESSEQQKWKFTTYERDAETGDDYAINRGYWPTLSRFRQADLLAGAVSNPQSLNRNSYVGNDPINLIDPLGLYWALTNCHAEVRWNPDEEIFEVTGREICDLVWIPDGPQLGPVEISVGRRDRTKYKRSLPECGKLKITVKVKGVPAEVAQSIQVHVSLTNAKEDGIREVGDPDVNIKQKGATAEVTYSSDFQIGNVVVGFEPEATGFVGLQAVASFNNPGSGEVIRLGTIDSTGQRLDRGGPTSNPLGVQNTIPGGVREGSSGDPFKDCPPEKKK